MKKTIRLTEQDLVKLVKKVLAESNPPSIPDTVKKCFTDEFGIEDFNKLGQNCTNAVMDMMKGAPLPKDPIKLGGNLAKCGVDIVTKVITNPFEVLGVGQRLLNAAMCAKENLGTSKVPVMY